LRGFGCGGEICKTLQQRCVFGVVEHFCACAFWDLEMQGSPRCLHQHKLPERSNGAIENKKMLLRIFFFSIQPVSAHQIGRTTTSKATCREHRGELLMPKHAHSFVGLHGRHLFLKRRLAAGRTVFQEKRHEASIPWVFR